MDFRVLRVCMASSDPLRTLRDIQEDKYTIRTFLDMIEILDAQATMQENATLRNRE